MVGPEEIVLVSGLPRSGTSMMMQMLVAGGLEPLSDEIRGPDPDNPRGYFELEAVKGSRADATWVSAAEGKVVKVISELLQHLPSNHRYRVVFMRRKLDEVLASQRVMLARRGQPTTASDQELKDTMVAHLGDVEAWVRDAEHVEALFVSYNRMMADRAAQVARVNEFFSGSLDEAKMLAAIDTSLYRQRPPDDANNTG